MTWEWHKLETTEYIDLHKSLTSGQHFTYKIESDTYLVTLSTIDIKLKEIEKETYFSCNNINIMLVNDILSNFFTLQINFTELFDKWNFKYTGLRLLKIDIVECIFSFICSQNNNIKRIKKMADHLKSISNDFTYFTFDNLEGFGYRSKYIKEAGVKINKIVFEKLELIIKESKHNNEKPLVEDNWYDLDIDTCKQIIYNAIINRYKMDISAFMDSFENEDDTLMKYAYFKSIESIFQNHTYDDVKRFLMSFYGIGQKVCDCILLNGYKSYHIVPQDVHMLRVNRSLGFKGSKEEIANQYVEKYGNYCGIAQIYLFNNSVNKRKVVENKNPSGGVC